MKAYKTLAGAQSGFRSCLTKMATAGEDSQAAFAVIMEQAVEQDSTSVLNNAALELLAVFPQLVPHLLRYIAASFDGIKTRNPKAGDAEPVMVMRADESATVELSEVANVSIPWTRPLAKGDAAKAAVDPRKLLASALSRMTQCQTGKRQLVDGVTEEQAAAIRAEMAKCRKAIEAIMSGKAAEADASAEGAGDKVASISKGKRGKKAA